MSDYQLGLVSISFRKHSPQEIIQAVKDAGLTCVEWGSDVHAPCHDIARLEEIADLQRQYGIVCSSYGTYFRVGQTPIETLPDYIKAAKILGTNVLRLWCGVKSGDQMTDEERAYLFDQCKKAAAMAEEHQVILCMECHYGTWTQNPDDAVALMQAVNSPCFRMYWQPFQCLDTKGSLAVAQKIAPYAHHIHVFNWHGNGKFPLQEGISDWQSYLTAFSTPRTLLLEFMPDDRLETLPTEAKALKTIVGIVGE